MMFFHHCHRRCTLQLLDAFGVDLIQFGVMKNHLHIRCVYRQTAFRSSTTEWQAHFFVSRRAPSADYLVEFPLRCLFGGRKIGRHTGINHFSGRGPIGAAHKQCDESNTFHGIVFVAHRCVKDSTFFVIDCHNHRLMSPRSFGVFRCVSRC